MTAPPIDPGTSARLQLIAAWNGGLVDGARRTLAEVVDRLSVWRARLDGLGRALGEADCWSGPAADAAAATLLDLSRAAAAVQSAFDRSQDGWNALSRHARSAQELAEQALALGARPATTREDWPFPVPYTAADEALLEAAAAAAAARAAADAVSGLAVLPGGSTSLTVDDLLGRLGTVEVPQPPVGAPADVVAAWWGALSAVEQEALLGEDPAAVGRLDGVPAWARDRANRLVLERSLCDPSLPLHAVRTAHLVVERIEAEEAAGRTVQLHLLDLVGGRVALSLGDLDTADAVALLVPGVRTTPDDDLGAMVGDARDVAAAAEAAAPAVTVATVVWIGYRTPQTPLAMIGRAASVEGGRALAAALDGLSAARAAAGTSPARTTVLAHSYGTVVVDEAADQPGRLQSDAVVLLGSPGMSGDATALEAPEVYDAGSVGDPVSWSGWFGMPAGAPAFGATELPADTWAGHSDYYERDGATLAAIGEVVIGAREPD